MKAVIDLGTNTFHLLIADVSGSNITVYEKIQLPVKIGRGGVHKNRLTDDAIQRAFYALDQFTKIIDNHKPDEITVVGTAAIRDAVNGPDFMQEVKKRFGFSIKAISGDDEARLIYKGVLAALPGNLKSYLVMDIGGGSVEFVIVQNEQPQWMQSFRAGASRLIQHFHISDPITISEIQILEKHFAEFFEPLIDAFRLYQPTVLVGSAGSFETIAEVLVKDFEEEIIQLTSHAQEVQPDQFMRCAELLIHSTFLQRQQLQGLATFRIEMIVVAMLMTKWVMKNCNLQRLIVSQYSLKEGLLFYGL